MVAAGAVVTPRKIVRKGELWAGNPAVKMRDINEKDIESFRRSAAAYVRLGQRYMEDRPKAAE
jgi:carbonic anhydrase/acetyltransferase-like protein (isoleucine patch superfamily)